MPPIRPASVNGSRECLTERWRSLVRRSVGDQCLTTRRIGGTDRPVTSRVAHIDPPRTWGVRGVDGPIRARWMSPLSHSRTHEPS